MLPSSNVTTAPSGELLDMSEILGYLTRRGIISNATGDIEALSGGVSSAVYRVTTEQGSLIVKQALPTLRVQALWEADRRRSLTEAAALREYHAITPESTPELVDADATTFALVTSAMPRTALTWKDSLIASPTEPIHSVIAANLGHVLARWHRATALRPDISQTFNDGEAFEQLRIAPFHRTVQSLHPDVAPIIEACIAELVTSRQCLVHGDLSPKNVLVDLGVTWVIDFEVAHCGAAVFDLAFLTTHLMLKAVHTGSTTTLREAGTAFLDAYSESSGVPARSELEAAQIACLLLARVDGTSPATYLSEDSVAFVRRFALDVLRAVDLDAASMWRALESEVAA